MLSNPNVTENILPSPSLSSETNHYSVSVLDELVHPFAIRRMSHLLQQMKVLPPYYSVNHVRRAQLFNCHSSKDSSALILFV
jgi:hypothetical protein